MGDNQVTIIGAGPAGLAAAMQLKRYGVDFIILEKARIGGLLNNANLVENYPGFPGGIPGHQLVDLFESQVGKLGVEVAFTEVVSLGYDAGLFRIATKNQIYVSPIAVIASGTRPKHLPSLQIPEALINRVHSEILPIRDITGGRIAVIGAGDLAFDYALNLQRRNDVLILNRGTETRCLPILRERAKRSTHIRYRDRTRVVGIKKCTQGGLLVECVTNGRPNAIQSDFLVIAIGREPQIDFLSENLRMQVEDLERGGVLYWIGDVHNGIYRQAAISVGDGIMAAMKIHRQLQGR